MKTKPKDGMTVAMWAIGIMAVAMAFAITAHWGYCMAKPNFWSCF